MNALTVVLPLVALAYAAWLAVCAVRNRKRGKCARGGCKGCPLRDSCQTMAYVFEKEKSEGNPYE